MQFGRRKSDIFDSLDRAKLMGIKNLGNFKNFKKQMNKSIFQKISVLKKSV